MSQERLARLVTESGTELSAAYVAKLESGSRRPGSDIAAAMDEVLGTGTLIQEASGHYPIRNLDKDFAKLRDQVARIEAQLVKLAADFELHSRDVPPSED